MASLFGRGNIANAPAGVANATLSNAFDYSIDGGKLNAYAFTNLDATNYLAVSVNPMHCKDSTAGFTVGGTQISAALIPPGGTQIFQAGSNGNIIHAITVWGQAANGTGAVVQAIGFAVSQR